MSTSFSLAVCAEMTFTELPFVERVRRIDELDFQVEIWDWSTKDIDALAATGATFSSMTGYLTGRLADADGAADLLRTAEQSLAVAEKLDCARLNLHGTGLDGQGLPLGLHLIGREMDEQGVLNAGLAIEERAGFTARPAKWW